MKAIILVVVFLCSLGLSAEVSPLQESAKIEQDILNGKLHTRTQKALSALIMTAAGELRKRGHNYEAANLENEWFDRYQHDFMAFAMGRDIGDHAPLWQWLADQYNKLEFLLGVDVCKKTHLSDLKTFNHTIPVVFRPCKFPMDSITIPRKDEYRNHFAEGEVYYGLVPVVCYWGAYSACSVGTMGTGYVFLCGIAGSVAERLMALVAPKLSDKVYDKACGGA